MPAAGDLNRLQLWEYTFRGQTGWVVAGWKFNQVKQVRGVCFYLTVATHLTMFYECMCLISQNNSGKLIMNAYFVIAITITIYCFSNVDVFTFILCIILFFFSMGALKYANIRS